jgi:hypothetical protein
MPVLSYIHQLCSAEHCQAHLHSSGGKIVPYSVPGTRARTLIRF